tara:strand:- start:7358 stop:7597 length:240 start_codon:yes stop_codon:yes gene_type:complete
MNYPDISTLKNELIKESIPENVAEQLASKFAGEKISCNHRIAQKACFDASPDNVDVASSAAAVLCGYVDESQCGLNVRK